MIKKTFLERGIDYAAELSLLNTIDLEKIIQWNIDNDIRLFRLSSDIFPWASEYGIENLPNISEIKKLLKRIGKLATDNNVRLTTHPGPFNVLCSPKDSVVQSTLVDLELHGKLFDYMGLSRSPYNKINIHCNGVYGDKFASLARFVQNFKKLSKSVRSRLTIENDDYNTKYSVNDLMSIHDKIGIPIVFDYHHHKFNTGGMSEKDALKLAISTWGNIKPVVHMSSSRSEELSDSSIKPAAHSDFILTKINTYYEDVDVMLEAKAKQDAVFMYRAKYVE